MWVWGERGIYLALQNAETALEDVHDGVVDALPMVDHLVVVDARNQKHGAVVLARAVHALLLGLVGVPSALPGRLFLCLRNVAQELDVARRKQIPAAVDVDDGLAGLDALAIDEFVELALFLLDGLGSGGCGRGSR